jgi:hypothetical protein
LLDGGDVVDVDGLDEVEVDVLDGVGGNVKLKHTQMD